MDARTRRRSPRSARSGRRPLEARAHERESASVARDGRRVARAPSCRSYASHAIPRLPAERAASFARAASRSVTNAAPGSVGPSEDANARELTRRRTSTLGCGSGSAPARTSVATRAGRRAERATDEAARGERRRRLVDEHVVRPEQRRREQRRPRPHRLAHAPLRRVRVPRGELEVRVEVQDPGKSSGCHASS